MTLTDRLTDGQHEPWMPEYPAWKLSAACATSTANFFPTRGESCRPANYTPEARNRLLSSRHGIAVATMRGYLVQARKAAS
jgi:hypothetical protein